MSIIDPQIRLSNIQESVRKAAVAGMFYPDNPEDLRRTVDRLLEATGEPSPAPKAIISPHAGYIYSGSTAAQAFSGVRTLRNRVRRVVLLGPAHRVYVNGLAISGLAAFRTPLGLVRVDQAARENVLALPQVSCSDPAHEKEHSLEVQLPFLQQILGDFQLVPLVVGEASAEEVAEVLELLWGGEETLLVISSDLSHYQEYSQSRQIDAETSSLIENFDYQHISPQQACGAHPIRGLLLAAGKRQMRISRRALCNSGDTAGRRDRVVGYGAWCLYESHQGLDDKKRRLLLNIAQNSIEQGFETGRPVSVNPNDLPADFNAPAACFVTLSLNGRLRGCIGNTQANQPLAAAVATNAFSAAFKDPRFKPLTKDEFAQLGISISVLTPHEALSFSDEKALMRQVQAGIHGLTIEEGQRRATFLPSVWESLHDKASFLARLKEKAGIDKNTPVSRAWRYRAEIIKQTGDS